MPVEVKKMTEQKKELEKIVQAINTIAEDSPTYFEESKIYYWNLKNHDNIFLDTKSNKIKYLKRYEETCAPEINISKLEGITDWFGYSFIREDDEHKLLEALAKTIDNKDKINERYQKDREETIKLAKKIIGI